MKLNGQIQKTIILCVFIFLILGCKAFKKERLPKGYHKISTILQTNNEKCNEFYKMVHENLYLNDLDSCKQFKLISRINPDCIYGLTKEQVVFLFGKESCWENDEMLYVFSNDCSAKGTLKERYRTYQLKFENDTVYSIQGSEFGWNY